MIGTRGLLIAIIGSILPIAIGIVIAIILDGTNDIKSSIAAGATFGPTSLGIALNILRSGGILNTPVGQMIISAAVIDDMIALIVLSQLESLAGTIDAAGILIPVISAVLFLLVGGAIALFVLPGLVEKYVLVRTKEEHKGQVELTIMFGLLLAMMPATYYAKASYLMGAFIAGLGFCTSHELHATFVSQFKRLMQWLMRIFFAASIGFQVPIKDFGNGTVILQGLFFTVALLGKLAVGFMVPNFTQSRSYTGFHLRDCLVTGFSMAAEGEFAFVIAVFAVDNELIDKDLYASVVLAVLLSTIIPPFALRFTISYYNKKAEEQVQKLAQDEMDRQHELEDETLSSEFVGDIRSKRAVFLCIQTQSESRWGLMTTLMQTLAKLGLDVIDHRAWHPRGINTTLINEIYAKDNIEIKEQGRGQQVLAEHISDIENALKKCIKQEDAKVKVQRWYPGVVEEIVEDIQEKRKGRKSKLSAEKVQQQLLAEAAEQLDRKQALQLAATKEKTVDEILAGMKEEKVVTMPAAPEEKGKPARRRRQKMRSTPVVGGGLFGETSDSQQEEKKEELRKTSSKKWKPDFDFGPRTGYRAEILVDGESYDVRISSETLKALRTGYSGDTLDNRGVSVGGVSIRAETGNVVNNLQGYVRNAGTLGSITEIDEDESDTSSVSAVKPHANDHNGADDMPPV